MKIIKTLMLLLFIGVGISSQARAQKLSSEEKALVLTFRMSKYLQLTEVQKTSIMKIHQQSIEQMEAAQHQYCDNKEALRKAKKEIMTQRNVELQKVLSADQFALYQQKQKEAKAQMQKDREAARNRKAAQQPLPAKTPGEAIPQPQK